MDAELPKLPTWPMATFVVCVVLLGLFVSHRITYAAAPLLPGGQEALANEVAGTDLGQSRQLEAPVVTSTIAAMHGWLQPLKAFGLLGLLVSGVGVTVLAGRRSPALAAWAHADGVRARGSRLAVVAAIAPAAFIAIEFAERVPGGEGAPPMQVLVLGVILQSAIAYLGVCALRFAGSVVRQVLRRLYAGLSRVRPQAARRWSRSPEPFFRGLLVGAEPARGPPTCDASLASS